MEKSLEQSLEQSFKWVTIDRPGYFGKRRDSIQQFWNEAYGVGWRLAWQWGDSVIPREMAMKIYEDGYYEHFKKNPDITNWLISTASDVYDTHPSNVEVGLEYRIDDTPSNHIHDIAIRRSIKRLGLSFKGDHLMHVRWTGSEGYKLNPGVVPFHMPEMISRAEMSNYAGKIWWEKNSIEDFYQRNKVLQVKE